ncbi:MAG: Hsp70 family protein [Labilithrix sp.]|nr:Hsp70 family protein [Labilithrix sp.]MCW5809603.1 Hsp70 family protein [Labilithrix sp.]
MALLDRAVGIDLGTTNSEVAWLPPSEREITIYADRFGRKTVPSAVAWDAKQSAFVVGHAARSKRGTGEAPIESVKRKMGQKTTVAVGPHQLNPEEVSSKILIELRDRIRETLKPMKAGNSTVELPVTRAVITVPAYFDAPQVEATRRAGELAGLDVIGILQEPTAAAIYHTWKRRLEDGNFLVYDLGGGTFDVSILRCVGGEYQVLAIDGDNFLGGDDFDRRYAEHLRKQLVEKGYSLDLDVKNNDEDRRIFGRLVHLAQEIKESLSTTEVAHVSKNDIVKDKAGESVSFEGDIGRADYEEIIADLVETTMACCERALARAREVANVGAEEIDHVILVGGSTRVPLVVKRVTAAYCKRSPEPLRDDVDTCVALGAAVHAAHVGGTRLVDEASKSRVRITSPLVAQGNKLRLTVAVEEAPKTAAHLAVWEGENPLGEAPIPKPGETVRFEVPLGEAEETAATLALQTSVGAPLAELPLVLHRGDLRPRPTALSRASVIAKDVALEVVRGGKRDRKILLARGTGLPAQVTHMFFTADQSGAVVLRILQNRLPIKTLAIDVPRELPVGSPVEVVLRCDESMRLEAKATVGAQQIQAHIEPPPNETAADAGDIEQLLDRAEKAKRALWGGLGEAFAAEADRLVVGIREVLHTDPDKLVALSERLRHLIDEFHGGVGEALVPPMARMETAFHSLRLVAYRAEGALLGMSKMEWEKRIDTLYDKALEAHSAADGPTWRRIYNEVQALCETAYQEEFSQIRMDDPAYILRRTMSLSWRSQQVERQLADLVPSTTDEIRVMQANEQKRIEKWLADGVKKPLEALKEGQESDDPKKKKETTELRRLVEKIDTEIERIEAAVERLPSIGLVTDRGSGA